MGSYSSQQYNASDDDLELLSTYLDDQLDSVAYAYLERRLAADAQLQIELTELRATTTLLRALTPAAVPRSFALSPQDVATRPWSWVRLLHFAPVAAVLILGVMISGVFALGQFHTNGSAEMARIDRGLVPPSSAITSEANDTLPDTAPTNQANATESGATSHDITPAEGDASMAEIGPGREPFTPSAALSPDSPTPPRSTWLLYPIGVLTIALVIVGGLWIMLRRRK